MSEKMEILEDIKCEVMEEMDDVFETNEKHNSNFDFEIFVDRLKFNPLFRESVNNLAKEYQRG